MIYLSLTPENEIFHLLTEVRVPTGSMKYGTVFKLCLIFIVLERRSTELSSLSFSLVRCVVPEKYEGRQ